MRLEYFQLIDRILDLDLEQGTIRAEAHVPRHNTVFEGHFPGMPLMPGVLLIESMAQTSGWLLVGLHRFARMPFLVAVKEAKLRTFVTPGQVLSVSASLAHDGSGFAVTKAAARVDGKIVCNAEITLRLMPFADPTIRAGMTDIAKRIAFPLEAPVDV
jgi:3-hydroxyacyl-[acyl-carrier-protein] dehydratase